MQHKPMLYNILHNNMSVQNSEHIFLVIDIQSSIIICQILKESNNEFKVR